MVFCTSRVALPSVNVPTKSPPAVTSWVSGGGCGEALLVTVEFVTVTTPSVMYIAPPCQAVDVFPLIVELSIVAVPSVRSPPPMSAATLPLTVLRMTVVVVLKKE